MFRKTALLGAAAAFAFIPAWSQAQAAPSILFIGNSFTYAAHSAVKFYHPETVHDLNAPDNRGQTIGGVPALFKAFTKEAGLDYDVSLETIGGVGFDAHLARKRTEIDKPWDIVVGHGFSTLDGDHPGNPALLISTTKELSDLLAAKNPQVKFYLLATWSRADMTYPRPAGGRGGAPDGAAPAGRRDPPAAIAGAQAAPAANAGAPAAPRVAEPSPWLGKPIQQMGKDIEVAYEQAARGAPHVAGIIPMGLAWNNAIDTGVADNNPYDDLGASKMNLWAYDSYHASSYGYYLEALLDFGKVTGRDPMSLAAIDNVAEDLGISRAQAGALQKVAHDALTAQGMVFVAAPK